MSSTERCCRASSEAHPCCCMKRAIRVREAVSGSGRQTMSGESMRSHSSIQGSSLTQVCLADALAQGPIMLPCSDYRAVWRQEQRMGVGGCAPHAWINTTIQYVPFRVQSPAVCRLFAPEDGALRRLRHVINTAQEGSRTSVSLPGNWLTKYFVSQMRRIICHLHNELSQSS